MCYVNCESAKGMPTIRLFAKKKLSIFKEVAIFSIISFKIAFSGLVKYCSFTTFLV